MRKSGWACAVTAVGMSILAACGGQGHKAAVPTSTKQPVTQTLPAIKVSLSRPFVFKTETCSTRDNVSCAVLMRVYTATADPQTAAKAAEQMLKAQGFRVRSTVSSASAARVMLNATKGGGGLGRWDSLTVFLDPGGAVGTQAKVYSQSGALLLA
jgi:hypothetical protein